MNISTTGASFAGTEYALTCTADAAGGTAQLQWMDSSGAVLNSSSSLTVDLQDDGSLQLKFTSLAGEHEDSYTCKAVMTWPASEVVVIKHSTVELKGQCLHWSKQDEFMLCSSKSLEGCMQRS